MVLWCVLPLDEINPLLSSVYAKNKSSLSVQIVWRLTAHGAFTSALVTLSLRLLNSSNWRYAASDTFQDRGLYQFDGLQPKSAYLLNVSLYNRHKETESKAIVFWSPTSNYSGRRLQWDHTTVLQRRRLRLKLYGFLALSCDKLNAHDNAPYSGS